MNGTILGKVGAINIVKKQNTLQLDCVLYGEGFSVNPNVEIFHATLEIEEGKDQIKAEANNKILMSIWTWMSFAEVDNLNQLIGQPVIIQVENDELKDFQIISKEQERDLLERNKEKEN